MRDCGVFGICGLLVVFGVSNFCGRRLLDGLELCLMGVYFVLVFI